MKFPCITELDVSCYIGVEDGRQALICSSNNQLASLLCSLDGGPPESCYLLPQVDISRLGTGQHIIEATAVDVFGQSLDLAIIFRLIQSVSSVSDPNVPLETIFCSYDGGATEMCSLSLQLEGNRFGTDSHTVVFVAVNSLGQTVNLTVEFQLIEREYILVFLQHRN